MDNNIRDRIEKVYALVNQGATEGERIAARHQLAKILKRYNIDEESIKQPSLKSYFFPYRNYMESTLLMIIMEYLRIDHSQGKRHWRKWRNGVAYRFNYIELPLTYETYIECDCMYQYFRRHMRGEYEKVRTNFKRRKRQRDNEFIFVSQYTIKSGIVRSEDLVKADPKLINALNKIYDNIEGGSYKRQVDNVKLLEHQTHQ